MAKANWVNLSKESGEWSDTVDVSATPNTGRNQRTTQLTWTGTGVQDQVRTVVQQGSPVVIGSWPSNVSANYAGATLRVRGRTNADRLRFVLGEGGIVENTGPLDGVTIPKVLQAAGVGFSIIPYLNDTTNPTSTSLIPIPGDPGATAAYDFELDIYVPENRGEQYLSRQLIVYGPTDNIYAICNIISSNDFPYIVIPEGDIILSYTGSKKSITFQSNTEWEIK